MVLRHLQALLVCLLATGCDQVPVNHITSLPDVQKQVNDLVAICETMLAEGAKEQAETVIRLGEPALPTLLQVWKDHDDPDAVVWTHACIICIRKRISLHDYLNLLKQHLADEKDPAYAGHAAIIGDDEALLWLYKEFGGQAEGLTFNADLTFLYTHGGKQLGDQSAIRRLRSPDARVRNDAVFHLQCLTLLPEEPPYPVGDYPYMENPEQCEKRIAAIEKIWEQKRPLREKFYREGLDGLRRSFRASRFLLDLPPGELCILEVRHEPPKEERDESHR